MTKFQQVTKNNQTVTNHKFQVTKSLKDYLDIIEPGIIPELITTKNWDNIKTVASVLPQSLTNYFGFEYRLGNNTSYTDFLVCAGAYEAGKKVLGNEDCSINLPSLLMQEPEWQNINNFSQSWNNTSSPLHNLVYNVWLEFDIEEIVSNHPIPSAFFGVIPTENKRGIKQVSKINYHPHQWVTETALPLLLNRQLPEKVKEKVLQCFDNLPQDAYIFQIGLMLARKVDAVRLCIRNIQLQAVIPFLKSMNWLGCTDNLSQLLKELENVVDRIDLDIDVGENIYPKIGLECYLAKQPSLEPKWNLFLDYLVIKGLCTPEKRHKLLNYPGYIRERDFPQALSVGTLKLNQLLGSKYETVFFKGLHHIKLTYQNQDVLEAKAYLYVSHNRINVAEFNAVHGVI
ncbi:MAG: hypothetical protein AAFW70_10610 [Cyanobacteria bacterium J06635_10]